MRIYKENLENILLKIIDRSIYYIPNCGNAGDAAIALGTYHFFQKVKIKYKTIPNTQNKELHDEIIVLGGGGNLVEGKYRNTHDTLTHYIKNNICIILPHTIVGYKDILPHTYSNLYIFCRDQISFNNCIAAGGNPEQIFISDDMAFSIDDKLLDYYRAIPGKGHAYCLRTDKESLGVLKFSPDNRDISRSQSPGKLPS